MVRSEWCLEALLTSSLITIPVSVLAVVETDCYLLLHCCIATRASERQSCICCLALAARPDSSSGGESPVVYLCNGMGSGAWWAGAVAEPEQPLCPAWCKQGRRKGQDFSLWSSTFPRCLNDFIEFWTCNGKSCMIQLNIPQSVFMAELAWVNSTFRNTLLAKHAPLAKACLLSRWEDGLGISSVSLQTCCYL